MKHHSFIFLSILSLCGFLSACQDTVNTIENADKAAVVAPVKDARFVSDSFLKNRLVLQGVKTSQTANGLLMVEVTALNNRTGFFSELWSWWTNENPYPIDYKFTWQDAGGMTVETPLSIWKTVRIHPGETFSFRATAPTPACKDFVLSVKESDSKLK